MRNVTPFGPYEYIFAKYKQTVDENLYWRDAGGAHPFRESVRLKLTPIMLQVNKTCILFFQILNSFIIECDANMKTTT